MTIGIAGREVAIKRLGTLRAIRHDKSNLLCKIFLDKPFCFWFFYQPVGKFLKKDNRGAGKYFVRLSEFSEREACIGLRL